MNLTERVFESLEGWGSGPVMVETAADQSDRILGRDEFRGAVLETAEELKSMGIRPRTAVPLFLENSADFPVVFLALILLNAVPVMVKLDYRRRELRRIFDNLAPDVVISEKNHLSVLAPWLADLKVIVRDSGGLTLQQTGPEACRSIDVPDDVATINYTYRGYGYPLGSMASHAQYIHGAEVLQDGLQARAGDSMLVILPMSHIFTLIGCLMVPLLVRMTAVVARTMNPIQLFDLVRNNNVAHLLSVPEVYELLNRFRKNAEGITSLRSFVSGGSLLTPEKYREYGENFGVEVLHGYGLTEFTPASRNMRGNSRPGTIGPICGGVECTLAEDGEILLTTPDITRGYYRRPEETAEAFDGKAFRTGDIGRFDDDHLVFLREKKKTRKINGNIVDLTEVEQAIEEFEHIDRFRLDFANGRLTANVSFTKNRQENLENLREELIDSMARYKVPKLVLGGEI